MKISVCIPTRGERPELLARAVASAGDAHEVLVYENDDGCPGPSINKAIEEATGDWLLWLSDDDWLLPGAIERLTEQLGGDLLFYNFLTADIGGSVIGQWSYADRPTDPDGLIAYTLGSKSCAIPMVGPMRLAWIRDNGLRFVQWETTGYSDDSRTLLEWMRHKPDVRYVPGQAYVYTLHPGQFSYDTEQRAAFEREIAAYKGAR